MYVKPMYNNIEYTVLNTCNICRLFRFQRGVTQWWPLTTYLLITALEALTNKIRNDKFHKRIKYW